MSDLLVVIFDTAEQATQARMSIQSLEAKVSSNWMMLQS